VLGCLDRQMRIFETGGHPDFGIIAAVLDYFEGFPDQYHHPKEDLLLARLSERDQTSAHVVGDLAQAHVELGDNLRTFATAVRAVLLDAELPRDTFVGRARDFIDSQRRHLAMEEASFFPAAERALTADDWSELGASVPRILDSLHGGEDESKYESSDGTFWRGMRRTGGLKSPTNLRGCPGHRQVNLSAHAKRCFSGFVTFVGFTCQ